MTVPWSLYFLRTKWVAVLRTESIGDSFSDTNCATSLHRFALNDHGKIKGAGHQIYRSHPLYW